MPDDMNRYFLLATIGFGVSSASVAETVDFSRDIKPLLAQHCWKCHGPDESSREADLRLDDFSSVTADRGGYAVLVPGVAAESTILDRVRAHDEDERMPPAAAGRGLNEKEIRTLEAWINAGATFQQHWSFEPIRNPVPPLVADAGWSRNAIDRFVFARLLKLGLAPSPLAERATLIRRLYLDLLGLLPTPEAVAGFQRDDSSDAYESLVDSLLANPHFGERWGRYWLDQARYADSNGYTIDGPRVMWPYRNWVIDAFNRDQPFDMFTTQQLAGDLSPSPTLPELVATGFHRNTLINTEGGVKADQFRDEQVKDRVDTTGVVWMGLTVGCAKCHSHKYDPIQQDEYYALYAFFNSTQDNNSVEPIELVAEAESRQRWRDLRRRIQELKERIDEATPKLATDGDESAESKELQKWKSELSSLESARDELEDGHPLAMVLRELRQARQTHVQVRGDFLRPEALVTAGTPQALPTMLPSKEYDRRFFANWLMDKDHPLTARVRVNRIWMRLWGRGLVETENDFGVQGSLPSHPLLLDWLARDFQRDWSTKRLIRLIVTSSTYRQSSQWRAELSGVDPQNRWLARQSRLRVEAEIVRDLALSASQLLTNTLGGPSVYPPQPDGVYAFTQVQREWPTDTGADRYRRGMYTFFFRSAPHPLMTTFDVPKFNQTCTCRDRSNTPLQSLTVANDEALFEMATGLAERVLREIPTDQIDADSHRLQRLFKICMARSMDTMESERLHDYLVAEQIRLGPQATKRSVWTSIARVVMNLDEFITRE